MVSAAVILTRSAPASSTPGLSALVLPFAYAQPVFTYRSAPDLPVNPYDKPSAFTVAPSIVSFSPPIYTA